MLKRLRRWLGWDDDSGVFVLGSAEPRPKGTSATHGLFVKQAQQTAKPAPRTAAAQKKPAQAPGKPAAQTQPRLSLDKPPAADNFDPYNTGAFNRSQSWEKISRRGR